MTYAFANPRTVMIKVLSADIADRTVYSFIIFINLTFLTKISVAL